jgi:hypothetical protein
LFTAFDAVEPAPAKAKNQSPPTKEQSAAKYEDVLKQMNELSVSMSSEIKPVNELQVSIMQRLIQVQGDLFEYNPLEDCDILRAKGCFLCLDQTE